MGAQYSTGVFPDAVAEFTGMDLDQICRMTTSSHKKFFLNRQEMQKLLPSPVEAVRILFGRLDVQKRGRIVSSDLWGALCLASSGSDPDKISFLFNLADLDSDGSVNEAELVMAIHSSCRGLARMKGIPEPSTSRIEILVKENFRMRLPTEITATKVLSMCRNDSRIRNYMSNLDSSASADLCALYSKHAQLLRELSQIDSLLESFDRGEGRSDGCPNKNAVIAGNLILPQRSDERDNLRVKECLGWGRTSFREKIDEEGEAVVPRWRLCLRSLLCRFRRSWGFIDYLKGRVTRQLLLFEEERHDNGCTFRQFDEGIDPSISGRGDKKLTNSTMHITIGKRWKQKSTIKFDVAANRTYRTGGCHIKTFAHEILHSAKLSLDTKSVSWLDFPVLEGKSEKLLERLVLTMRTFLEHVPPDDASALYSHYKVDVVNLSSHDPAKVVRVIFFHEKDLFEEFQECLPTPGQVLQKLSLHIGLNLNLEDLFGNVSEESVGATDLYEARPEKKNGKTMWKLSVRGEYVVRCIFNKADLDKDGLLNLHELNRLQRQLGGMALSEQEHSDALHASGFATKCDALTYEGLVAYYKEHKLLDADSRLLGIEALDDMLRADISMTANVLPAGVRRIESIFDPARGVKVYAKAGCFIGRFCSFLFGDWEFAKLSEMFPEGKDPEWITTPGFVQHWLRRHVQFLSDGKEGFLHQIRRGVSTYFGTGYGESKEDEWRDPTPHELEERTKGTELKKVDKIIEIAKSYGINNGKYMVGEALENWFQFAKENEVRLPGLQKDIQGIIDSVDQMEQSEYDAISKKPPCTTRGMRRRRDHLLNEVKELSKNMPKNPSTRQKELFESRVADLSELSKNLEHGFYEACHHGLKSYDGMRALLSGISQISWGNNEVTATIALDGVEHMFSYLPAGD